MKRFAAVIALLTTAPLYAGAQGSPEATLLAVPSAAGAIASSRFINSQAHYAGSPGDKRLAEWMAQQLRAAGFRTTIESFTTLVPERRHVGLQILERPVVTLDLHERPIPVDPDGTRPDAGVPFNAWSGSGSVRATLVNAGAGLDADYEALRRSHVDVRGRIALVRYGAEFRGLLAARAQRNGAAGVILYSDPSGRDGSANGPAYPNGPYRPLGSVQRGSLGNGIRIPVLPVTALTAQRLLRTRAPIRLTVDEPLVRRTLWNTIGVLQGTDPSQEVVLGGHRDAWVYGVTDNGDGISTLIESAKALGTLARSGWHPQRTIIIAGWDGEEIGELGSTEYVRAHRDRLLAGCIAYVNFDEGESGEFFGASAAGAVAPLAAEIAESVNDPLQPSRTLAARWQTQRGGAVVRSPGGGSDFEPFLYDAGVPTIDWGFAGPFGVYHSGFDDLRYAMTEADPRFVNHQLVAQMLALVAYRLAGGPLHAIYHLTQYEQTLRDDLANVPRAYAAQIVPLSAAVDRYAAAASASQASDAIVLDAVRRLDLLCYGRNGYAAIPLPDLSAAIASGNGQTVAAAASRTAAMLDAIAQELER